MRNKYFNIGQQMTFSVYPSEKVYPPKKPGYHISGFDSLMKLKYFRRNQKMNDYYVEVLVKRDVEKEKKKRRLIMLAIMAILLVLGIATRTLISFYLFAGCVLGYHFLVQNYCVEFEYFYMDGEFTISKIINRSRRKKILELNDGVIKLIAPVNSVELQMFSKLKRMDCTANEPLNLPYAIVYMNKGELKAVNIQMTEEMYKELKKSMPYKVKRY